MLAEAYGHHALSEATCKRWFQRFRDNDFEDHKKVWRRWTALSQKKKAAMLNVPQKTISDRLKAMGKIQKYGKCVPYDLNERQMENRKNS